MTNKYSNFQPRYKLFFLYVLSFGFYIFWWSYKTWKQLKEANFDMNFCKENKKKEMSGKISPWQRTISLIIPIVNLFVLHSLFKAMISYTEINNTKTSNIETPGSLLGFYLVLKLLGLGIIPFEIAPFFIIQSDINKVWKRTDKRPIKKWPYISEWLFLILVPPLVFLFFVGAYIDPTNFLPEESLIVIDCEDACLGEPNSQYSYVDIDPENENRYICSCLDSNNNLIAQFELTY